MRSLKKAIFTQASSCLVSSSARSEGVGLGTQRECLELMGCFGHGHAKKFAEIIAATALAGEIAICARIANGTFVKGHKKYGRKPVRKRIDRWPFFIQTVIMNKVKTSPNNILLHVNRSTFWAGFVLCVYSFFMYTLFVIQSSEKVNLYSIPPIVTSILYFIFGTYIFRKTQFHLRTSRFLRYGCVLQFGSLAMQ